MKRLLALTPAIAIAVGPAAPAVADVASDPSASQTIIVPKDKSAAFRLDYPASEIVVAQPDTLSLVATTDRSFYVRGKALGTTNILIYDTAHHLAQVVDVRVGYDVDSLQNDLAAALPNETIHAANFAGGILLTGEVTNSNISERAQQIAEHYAPKQVENELVVRAAQQVQVDVRILEASHTAVRDLGFNISVNSLSGFTFSTGGTLPSGAAPRAQIGIQHQFGAWNIDASLQALEQQGAIRELARPNLVSMSGQEASFLAGGEFPVPVPNGQLGGTTIEFRQFGVKLTVTPTVQDNGQIILKVAPEVSELDPKDGVNFQGFQVPAISERKASTQIELADGQSFAIAGLFQRNYSNTINQIPGASNLPVLGALFRSSDWQRNETELVIIVTPHLTTPVNDVRQLPNPLHDTAEANAIDVILDGKTRIGHTQPNPDGDLTPPPQTGPSASTAPPATAPQAAQAATTPAPQAAADAPAQAQPTSNPQGDPATTSTANVPI
jgi:pilus assembly protein CpaC